MKETEAIALLKKYKTGNCNPEEQEMLESWYMEWNEGEHGQLDPEEEDLHFTEAALAQLREEMWTTMPGPVIKAIPLWKRIAAVAAALLVIGMGLWVFNNQILRQAQDDSSIMLSLLKHDIKPGTNKATLTLANGKVINLNSAKTGVVIDAAQLTYNDGTEVGDPDLRGDDVAIDISGRHPDADQDPGLPMNAKLLTATTPRGGQYQVILSDGTHVWLNAASTLKFPSKFAGNKRKVELTGEAYFEVAKDKTHPFMVKSAGQEVEVLGTHFNINSYADETEVKTTLLEGSVKINNSLVLKPGQQSIVTAAGGRVIQVQTDDIVAWKNGYFMFNNESLESIMRKISRWYNVDVVYKSAAARSIPFFGTVSRFSEVSQVLKMLELTGEVRFEMKGKQIIVIKK